MGREQELTKSTSFTSSDFCRMIISGASRLITVPLFVDSLDAELVTQGFLKTGALPAGVEMNHVLAVKTTNYALTEDDDTILANCTSGDLTISLMTATSVYVSATTRGQSFIIKKTDASSNKVIIDASGTETIDGSETIEIVGPGRGIAHIISDGSNWHLIG
ncbi:MAG: hypothetical protein GY938_18025, partial [Ketobacter sp.]|nr:hypothetical protein [Ketobacter sp.]